MKEILILICIAAVFAYGYYGMKKVTPFIKENRRKRRNYEYFYTDDDED